MRSPVPFGKYLLLDRISVGGMAEVFKAKSYGVEGFEKIIAIKRILPTMGEDRDFIKMFIDEAKIAGQLAHANICQIFELGRIDGSHFIAMEYIWGKDLLQIQNRLRKIKQPMPVPMACFVIGKVLEGLDYAHRKRDPLGRPLEIVHRDCSPQNVLVSYEGEVKVIDFGIAKATSRNSRTMAGVLKGKFGYMSPEQVRGLPLDRRSDIFALGTMLYECLTGERLFQGETDFSTLEKVRNVDIRPPRELNPQIPEAIEKVILKALAKEVDERYQWCSEMLGDLQTYLMGQDALFTPKSLSGWLKEVFASEIEKERGLLEQYKRVGRDGLIAGLPSAEAKVDVIESLGEAGAPEGDATQLGGPNFTDDDMAAAAVAAAAAPEIGPASGSPASMGAKPLGASPPPTAPQNGRAPSQHHDDAGSAGDSGDFGEEAPTEIFGDAEHGAALEQATAPQRGGPVMTPQQPMPMPGNNKPTSPLPPLSPQGNGPRMTPPGARPSAPAQAPAFAGMAAAGGSMDQTRPSQPGPGGLPGLPGMGGPAGMGNHAPHSPQNQPMGGYAQVPSAQGYNAAGATLMLDGSPPNGNGAQMNGLAPPGSNDEPARTLLGAARPPGVPWYGPPGGNPSGQMAAVTPPGGYGNQSGAGIPLPGMSGPHNGSGPLAALGQPGGPFMPPNTAPGMGSMGHLENADPSGGGGYPNPGGPYGGPSPYNQQGYGQPQPGYGMAPAPAIEAPLPQEGPRPKKASIGRDIAIGVAIAAIVLGGFLAFKFLVMDRKSASQDTTTSASIATIKISLTAGGTAELFVDGDHKATVRDKQDIPMSPGKRKVRLVGPTGARCEKDVDLVAGKTTTMQCTLAAAASQGSGSGAGSGSAAITPSTKPTTPTTPTAAGSGSAAVKVTPTTPTTPTTATGSGSGSGSATQVATIEKPITPTTPTTPTTKPIDTKPVTPTTPTTKPVDTKPTTQVTKPVDTKPTTPTTKPVDTKPTTKPVDTKPTTKPDTKPTTKPTTKPVDTKPTTKPTELSPADRAAALGAQGYLQVYSKPSAKVAIDGAETGLSTPVTGTRLKLSPGKHKVTLTVGTGDKHSFPVTIEAGKTATVSKDLQ